MAEGPSRFNNPFAYIEGWGLYAEYLGLEMKLYEGDLLSEFGYEAIGKVIFGFIMTSSIFTGHMTRACRLVVDTGTIFYKSLFGLSSH